MKELTLPVPDGVARRHRTPIAMLLCAALAGCSGGGGSDNSSAAQANGPVDSASAASQALVDNEDLSAGLKGIDADGNGIRDDIDRLIAKKYAATPPLKKAAEQYARALQKDMEATTRSDALASGDGIMRAGACTDKVLAHSTPDEVKFQQRLSIEIEALTANTRERFVSYWNSQKLSNGAVFEQAHEPVCD